MNLQYNLISLRLLKKSYSSFKMQAGFTAFELMVTLITLCFVVLVTNKYLANQAQVRIENHLADQGKNFSQIAKRYIEDNYRSLVQQTINQTELLIPYTTLSDYMQTGTAAINKNKQVPCLYVIGGQNNTIRAYLIFGNIESNAKSLNELEVDNIAQTIGDHAGVLVNRSGQYYYRGGVENNLELSSTTINNIIQGCKFIDPLPASSLIIDLTKSNYLFASLQGNIDHQTTQADPDPSLKKSSSGTATNQLTTMQTNLYLDNIVKESSASLSEQHIYRSVDFSAGSVASQRVQVIADAAPGAPVAASQLDIKNAGIQAGYIAPNSHNITAGTSCSSIELGKLAQELTSSTILKSQLQCMYNPTFCSNSGYCYLPIKTSLYIYQYSSLQYSGQCPAGTIVDSNQPASGISNNINCPNLSGWTLSQDVHGEGVNCYSGVGGMSYCTGYQAVCSYKNQSGGSKEVQVLDLAELECTNVSTTFTVNNYTP